MIKHYQLTITGKVQGVWYRGSAQQKARELGLSGFVRNQPDGSVYAEVEGDETTLAAFVAWCWQGPPLAKVGQVTQQEGAMKHFSGFEVAR